LSKQSFAGSATMTPHFFAPRPPLVRIFVSNFNSPSRRSFDSSRVACSRL
jgi:hypothetical protein